MLLLTLGIIITALGGLFLSIYIKKHKHSEEHMVCPIGQKCFSIVNGRFSQFFGIPIEYLGIIYYILIALLYIGSLFQNLPNQVILIAVLLSGIGFAFSMYLTIIQVFVIKKWCTLCLGSMALSFIIIVLSFLGYEQSFAEFAYTHRDLLKWIYTIGVFVGTTITTLHAYVFIKFLKDFKISRKEEYRLKMFSHTAWTSLGILCLSGLGLILTDRWREYIDSNAFIVIVVIIGVLVVYEIIVNMLIGPKLIELNFDDTTGLDHKHAMNRKIVFAMIGGGVVSWYSLLLLLAFDWFEYSSGQLFIGYTLFIFVAVIITMGVEVIIHKKSQKVHYESLSESEENVS